MNRLRWVLGFGLIAIIYGFYFHFDSRDSLIINGEKHLVVVIPSYNNKDWYKRNLDSVFAQNYSNYNLIYVDDCSPDGTGQLVENYIRDCKQEHRCRLIKNRERKGTLYNLYQAIHSCDNQSIIIDLDGDDWLYGKDVFQTINRAYDDHHVWLTYGQYVMYPERHLGLCRDIPQDIIEQNSYRKNQWMTSHLRTFYAGLFKAIEKDDFIINGEFYPTTSDMAFMYPMLEMAGGHIRFIDKIMYIYNNDTPINDYKVRLQLQARCERNIRNQEPYKPLEFNQAEALFLTT